MQSRNRAGSHSHDVVDVVDEQLRNLVADLVSHFHGGPGNHRGNEARWGKKGGLKAEVAGPNKGRITAFDGEGKGLTPLQYIMGERNCSFAEAVEWATHWLGMSPDYKPDPATDLRRKLKREKERREAELQDLADKVERVEMARALYRQSKLISGTAVERYLAARGISCDLPDDIRYLPASSAGGYEAMIVVARDSIGFVQAVQRVFIDGNRKAPIDTQKRTNGLMGHAVVRLPAKEGTELVLAEGPETGLSVWQAWGRETWIALGGISKLVDFVPADRVVVIARDSDRPHSPADKALTKAVKTLLALGVNVSIAMPPRPTKDNYDFNDALMDYGNDAVAVSLQQSLLIAENPLSRSLPLNAAREAVRVAISGSINASPDAESKPPVVFLNVGLGIGKTYMALQEIGKDPVATGSTKSANRG